ncbi:MAG: hypothetical protein GY898_11650 [Proteobacteria bacterium]|nr:hypothetical protein [Pseudomonadota bacterium]
MADDDDTPADDDDSAPSCDGDGDRFESLGCGGLDCDDANPAVHPEAPEVCGNGLDDDCDGACLGCGLCGDVSLEEDADAKLLGEAEDQFAAFQVRAAGDLNDDEFDDFLVSGGLVGSFVDGDTRGYAIHGPVAGTVSLAESDLLLSVPTRVPQASHPPSWSPVSSRGSQGARSLLAHGADWVAPSLTAAGRERQA